MWHIIAHLWHVTRGGGCRTALVFAGTAAFLRVHVASITAYIHTRAAKNSFDDAHEHFAGRYVTCDGLFPLNPLSHLETQVQPSLVHMCVMY